MTYDDDDRELSSDQLDAKYNPDGGGEHPVFNRAAWADDVLRQHTLSGYWDWVVHQIDEDAL